MLAQEKVNYWLTEAPVAEGGTNIERKRDDETFMSHLIYEISLKNPDTIYETYKKFYEDKGWTSPFENNPEKDENWDGHTFNILPDGSPAAIYGTTWDSPNKGFKVRVTLTLNGYDDVIFNGKVEIITAPNPQMILSYEFITSQVQMFSEPRDIFIISRIFGKDIQDLSKINFTKVPEKYKNEKIILSYKKLADSYRQKYKEFGDKYVDRAAIPGK